MRVGVVGVNHKLAHLELRELLANTCNRRLHPKECHSEEHFFVLLSTCNRTEIYFSSEDLAETHSYILNILREDIDEDFDQKLYSYFGQDCLYHLCRVTSGLDSAIVAETEIHGQVRAAYEVAQNFNKLPFDLHYLFQKSLSIAKKVRAALPLKPGLPDIGQAIYQAGQYCFRLQPQPKILFVGASEINEKVLKFLKTKPSMDITLCNRSDIRGHNLANTYKIPYIPLKQAIWNDYDGLIFGTKAPNFLFDSQDIKESPKTNKLIIDLSVPRNVNPEIGTYSNITLLNIDQINSRLDVRRKTLFLSIQVAEEIIDTAIKQQLRLFHSKMNNSLRLSTLSA